jgi:hypothetical protein
LPPTRKKAAAPPPLDLVRTNVVVPRDLSLDVDEKLLELKRAGAPLSWSGLVEIAVRELLDRRDLVRVVGRYGLGLRRK